jgi:proline iminopeptidase
MNNMSLFPAIEPFREDYLRVSDLHLIHYEEVGSPKGKPALFLHGGPGVGISPDYRRFFDPTFYRVILPDQRGAGKSLPHAELRENTTWDIVDDLEKLKNHLGLEKWLVFGGSWGSTLALAYAIKYPESVSGIIIRGVFLARQSELDWLHKSGMNQAFPDEWERFVEPIPLADRGDIPKAYLRILTGPDKARQLEAAKTWSRWEAATMNLIPDQAAIDDFANPEKALAIARIECQFTVDRFYLKSDNYLLENISKIRHIPVWIVQGRYDLICPVISAWELHRALPNSKLVIVPDGSHSPLGPGMSSRLVEAAEEFKGIL